MARTPKIPRAEEASVGYVARPRVYKLDEIYRDSSKLASNEFYHWLGVKNSGGIRVRTTRDKKRIAVLVLVSARVSVATYNPWEDVLDKRDGRLWYWGDAKAHPTKTRDDFEGNRSLARVWVAVNERRWADVPPILHFTKPAKGQVRFSGLCALSNLSDAWMEENGKRVRNYLATLDILPVEALDVSWIRERIEGVDERAPKPWQIYAKTGQYTRLVTYTRNVRSRDEQLPAAGTDERALLHDLTELDPYAFERVIVRAFESLDVTHQVHGTPRTRDGGFDFHGSFRLPPPLSYSIDFKGEVKRYSPEGTGVGPKDVARLVARLQRGEHGMFATTSYFTRRSQEEVLADRYPVELLHGGRLAGLLARCGATRRGVLDPRWVHAAK